MSKLAHPYYANSFSLLGWFSQQHGRTCRIWLWEEFCINSVHVRKVVHISHKYCSFHYIAHCQACLFQNSLHVELGLAGLFLDTSLNKTSSSRVDGNQSRGINEITNLYCLAIRTCCRRCLCCTNYFFHLLMMFCLFVIDEWKNKKKRRIIRRLLSPNSFNKFFQRWPNSV